MNKKAYVRQTNNFDARMVEHFGENGIMYITDAINKYGREKMVSDIGQQEELDSVRLR